MAADSVYGHNGFFRSTRTVAEGEWQNYTPVLTSTGGTSPSGYDAAGRYTIVGKTVHFWAQIAPNAGWSDGTGLYKISFPVSGTSGSFQFAGNGLMIDASLGAYYPITAMPNDVGSALLMDINSSSFASPGVPFTLANGDIIRISGTYEID
jgi:hypothetical protein